VGEARRSDFSFDTEPVAVLKDGQMLVKTLYLSVDPAMRGWMNEGKSYIAPVALGDVMRAGGVGEVVTSNHPGFAIGDMVSGMTNVQTWCVTDGRGFTRVDPSLAPLTHYLNVLGMPGMTAYFGLLESGQPKEGETVVVSGATGAVGATVGQVARIKGCRVVGIAGGPEKCRLLTEELGFDAAIDYRSEDVAARLAALCPKGIDVFFDNVGGEILDAALARLAMRGRVVLCGAISRYGDDQPAPGPRNYLNLLMRRGRMEGFIIIDYMPRAAEAVGALAGWLREGKLKDRVDVQEGFEQAPAALARLFTGENRGKQLVRIGEPPPGLGGRP
jgi:hypothetical protein